MAQATFVQDGLAIDYTPGSNVVAGQVVVQGSLVGVAKRPIASGVLGALGIIGVFDMVKDSSDIALGASLFWDADGDPVGGVSSTGAATTTRTANTFCGFALAAAGVGVGTVRMILRSVDATSAETLSLADLSDVGTLLYTAGRVLIGDGDSYEDQALTGPFSLSGAGLLAMDSATVAATGSAQGDAAAIAAGFTLVSAADATKGVKLPAAAAGSLAIVKNGANAVLELYPNTDDAINAITANSALSMAAYTSALLIAYDATTWYTVPLLPS